MYSKNLVTLIATAYVSVQSTAASAQQTYDADGALADFNSRTSISRGDAAMWATAINGLVGGYVVKTGNTFKILGKGKGAVDAPPQVDLKDRPVYHEWITGTQTVDAGLLAFFNFKQEKESLTELTVKDIFSVTDGSIKSDDCVKNRPATIGETTRYWCIAAATLSSINSKTYNKVKKLGKGEYGIATAGGSFANSAGKEATSYSASIVPYGPFVNGLLVADEPAPISAIPAGALKIIPKSIGNGPLMGLSGVTISLPK